MFKTLHLVLLLDKIKILAPKANLINSMHNKFKITCHSDFKV